MKCNHEQNSVLSTLLYITSIESTKQIYVWRRQTHGLKAQLAGVGAATDTYVVSGASSTAAPCTVSFASEHSTWAGSTLFQVQFRFRSPSPMI